jgi:hypothetical protein
MTQTQMETQVRTEVLGRITKAPTFARTTEGGVPVCRFTVATEVGPASNPVVKDICVVGNPSGRRDEPLAVACRRLAVGSLVFVPGVEYQTMRKVRGVRFAVSAVKADDVKLRARA